MGEVLIEKHWNGNVKRTIAELFWEHVVKAKSKTEVMPVISTARLHLMHVYRGNLFFLSTVRKDVPPMLVLELQHKIVNTLLDYFKNSLGETKIRENFSVIYQLLDEMVDGGFPFTTETNQLKDMIIPPSISNRIWENVTGDFAVTAKANASSQSKIPWRKADAKYLTNEIYFDIVEQVDAIIGANGGVVHCMLYGDIKCNCRLSGMPDLTLSFTRPSVLDDCSLHRCVRINRFQRERVVSFVPPDGNFKLLSYKTVGGDVPVNVKPTINFKPGSGHVHITVCPRGNVTKPITLIVITVPLPKETKTTSITANVGNVKYDQKKQLLVWEFSKLTHETRPVLEGTITLPPDHVPDEAPVVRAKFTVKMWPASGIKVDSLSVRGVSYKPYKGVRILTQAGKVEIRT